MSTNQENTPVEEELQDGASTEEYEYEYEYEEEEQVVRNRSARRYVKEGCRPRLFWFERFRSLIVLLGIGVFGVLSYKGANPLTSIHDGIAMMASSNAWLVWLLAAEGLRQVHLLLAENVSWYWKKFNATTQWMTSPWRALSAQSRSVLGRVFGWGFVFVITTVVLARILKTSPALAIPAALGGLIGQLPTIIQYVLFLFITVLQFVLVFWFMSKGGIEVYMPDQVRTRFSDVWGQDHVLARVKEVVSFLDEPEKIEAHGGYVPGGVLLWGPPGTGKTLIAEAIAGETGKPFIFVEPGAFQAMFVGVGILKVRALYKKIRKLSLRFDGVVVFFDEADVLGNRGSLANDGPVGMSQKFSRRVNDLFGGKTLSDALALQSTTNGECTYASFDGLVTPGLPTDRSVNGMVVPGNSDMGTLNALLAAMQGLRKPRGLLNKIRVLLGMQATPPPHYRILHIMATNRPDSLDAALLRPGRIDRLYKVGYPTKEGRLATLRGYLAKVSHDLSVDQIDTLAVQMGQTSGASVKDMVNEALIHALRDGRTVVNIDDMLTAKRTREFGLPQEMGYVTLERHAIAVHEASHAVAAWKVKNDRDISAATIQAGAGFLGLVASHSREDLYLSWKSDYLANIDVAVASLVGERMFFAGNSTSGVSSDMLNATRTASYILGQVSMGNTLAVKDPWSTGNVNLDDKLNDGVEALLKERYEAMEALLTSHKDNVLSLAHALETHKTLDGIDTVAVLEHKIGRNVDGRIYADENVKAALWAYHEEVLERRLSHDIRPVKLPDFAALLQVEVENNEVPAVIVEEGTENPPTETE